MPKAVIEVLFMGAQSEVDVSVWASIRTCKASKVKELRVAREKPVECELPAGTYTFLTEPRVEKTVSLEQGGCKIQLELPPFREVFGTIMDAHGKPLSRSYCRYLPPGWDKGEIMMGLEETPDGRYSRSVLRGSKIEFSHAEHPAQAFEFGEHDDSFWATTTPYRCDVRLRRGCTVRGRFVYEDGSPATGFVVLPQPMGVTDPHVDHLNVQREGGRFEFRHLLYPGKLALHYWRSTDLAPGVDLRTGGGVHLWCEPGVDQEVVITVGALQNLGPGSK